MKATSQLLKLENNNCESHLNYGNIRMWKVYLLELMKYINILVLFTPEKNLCLDNVYCIISKINSLKKTRCL